jgi:acetolactate synthase I/II/III large subunit
VTNSGRLPFTQSVKPEKIVMSVPPRTTAMEVALRRIARDVHPTVPTVPGGYNVPMLAAAVRAGFRLLVARSEFGASWIGAAMAWETRRPVIVIVITSPGVYGTIQALHGAFVNRVPLILLSGEASLPGSVQGGSGFDGPSVTRVTTSLTAWSTDVTEPRLLPTALARAVLVASEARRPVHLNIPLHVGAGEA